MKLLSLALFLLPLQLFASYDFLYPAGVCMKHEFRDGRKFEVEVATDKMQECCQVQQRSPSSKLKGIYHVNASGAKRSCKYRSVAKKFSKPATIPKRDVAAARGYGRTKFRFVKLKKS